MLVLTRKKDESIVIGEDIVITIVDVRGDKVRLGIDAPGTVPVHRMEVWQAIQREIAKSEESASAEDEVLMREIDEAVRKDDAEQPRHNDLHRLRDKTADPVGQKQGEINDHADANQNAHQGQPVRWRAEVVCQQDGGEDCGGGGCRSCWV